MDFGIAALREKFNYHSHPQHVNNNMKNNQPIKWDPDWPVHPEDPKSIPCAGVVAEVDDDAFTQPNSPQYYYEYNNSTGHGGNLVNQDVYFNSFSSFASSEHESKNSLEEYYEKHNTMQWNVYDNNPSMFHDAKSQYSTAVEQHLPVSYVDSAGIMKLDGYNDSTSKEMSASAS